MVSLLDQQRLLDETVVLASSDMGDPARHSSRSVPTLLLGAKIRGGRTLALGDQKRVSAHHLNPNNRVLTFVSQRLGVPITRFGDSADASILEGVLDA